jgi:hypothetical protein
MVFEMSNGAIEQPPRLSHLGSTRTTAPKAPAQMILSFITAIGESDCETIGDGILAQPANAVSSLSFAVFGIVVLFSMSGEEGAERSNRLIVGLLMIATGTGSVLFHGPQGSASHFLHDVTILLTMIGIVTMNVAGLRRWREHRVWMILLVTAAAVSVVLLIWPMSTNALAVAGLVMLVGQDIALHRSGTLQLRWWIAAVAAMGLALVFFVVGRTVSPFCDSESLVQGHDLWNFLAATALWAYFMATAPTRRGIEE